MSEANGIGYKDRGKFTNVKHVTYNRFQCFGKDPKKLVIIF